MDCESVAVLNVLNLGGGVQSTVLAVMADRGLTEHKPDVAIHADTQSDQQHVMDTIRWLSDNMSYEVCVVTAGSVIDDLAHARNSTNTGARGIQTPPVFVIRPDGKAGMTQRQCTREYKITPIEREIRRRLGLVKYQRWPKVPTVRQWFGISYDEIRRMRTARRKAIINTYPLVDLRMTRADCLKWWADNAPKNAPRIGRSACICCPFRSANEWLTLTPQEVDIVEKAEIGMRAADNPGMTSYLHYRMIDVRAGIEKDRQHKTDNPTLFDMDPGCDSGHCFV